MPRSLRIFITWLGEWIKTGSFNFGKLFVKHTKRRITASVWVVEGIHYITGFEILTGIYAFQRQSCTRQ